MFFLVIKIKQFITIYYLIKSYLIKIGKIKILISKILKLFFINKIQKKI